MKLSGSFWYNPTTESKRPDQLLINKKKINCYLVDFIGQQSENKRKYQDCPRRGKVVKHEGDGDASLVAFGYWSSWNNFQEPDRETGRKCIGLRINTIQTTALLKSSWI